jgi:hypothetical protein
MTGDDVRWQPWQDLFDGKTLDGWRVVDVPGSGKVQVEDGCIMLGRGSNATVLAWQERCPSSDYEVTLRAKLVGESDTTGIAFPVGESRCTLPLGAFGHRVIGLNLVDGKNLSENPSARPMRIENDRWYEVRLRVMRDRIRVWIDGSPVIDFPVVGHTFSTGMPQLNNASIDLYTWCAEAAIRSVQLRRVKADAVNAEEVKTDEQSGAEQISANSVRTWSDGAGHTVEAAFIKLEDGVVHLRRQDGKIVQVPMERLSKQDQEHIAEKAERSISP